MTQKWTILIIIFTLALSSRTTFSKTYQLKSPNKKIEIKINTDSNSKVTYSLFCNSKELVSPSPISLTLDNGTVLGDDPKVVDVKKSSVNNVLTPVLKLKGHTIDENYNELKLICQGNYSIVFRAYDIGIAYRFVTDFNDEITIKSEEVSFNFAREDTVYFPEEESFMSHNERLYAKGLFSELKPGSFCSLPMLVTTAEGINVLITEADLRDYAGLWLKVNDRNTLSGIQPAVALKEEAANDRDIKVTERADCIAKTNGSRTFPWRVMAIAETAGDLITNQFVWLL